MIGPASEAAQRAFARRDGDTAVTSAYPDLSAFLKAATGGGLAVHCAVVTGLSSWDDSRVARSEIHACDGLSDVPVVLYIDATVLPDLDGWDQHTAITWHHTEPVMVRSIVLAAANQYRRMLALKQETSERAGAIAYLMEGRFSFQTPTQARQLAALLAESAPDPDRVSVGLLELFMNAIEHGNLGIGYDRKSQLIELGEYDRTLDELLKQANNREKSVQVQVRRLTDTIEFDIKDEGEGFDSEPFLTFDTNRATATHGRGIASAKLLFFDDVTYIGTGNQVVAYKTLLQPETPTLPRVACEPETASQAVRDA